MAKRQPVQAEHTVEDFADLFAAQNEYANEAPEDPRIRKTLEKAMRSNHGDKRKSRHKGDRVQFNRRMQRHIRDRVAQLCKQHRITETDALEQAFLAWIKKMEKARAG
jgi:hypothetical protein